MSERDNRSVEDAPQEFLDAMTRGARFLQAGRPSKALPFLLRAHQLWPRDVDAALNLGGAYVMLNQHQKAIPILEAARSNAPDNSKIWINLGAAYLGNPILSTPEKQDRAIAAFEQALRLDPAAPSVNYNLGLVHRDRGEIDIAIAHFRRATAVNPLDRDAHKLLARLEREQGATPMAAPSLNGGHDDE